MTDHLDPIAQVEGKPFVKGYNVKWANGEAFFLWEAHANNFARTISHNALTEIYRKGTLLNTFHNGKLKRRLK